MSSQSSRDPLHFFSTLLKENVPDTQGLVLLENLRLPFFQKQRERCSEDLIGNQELNPSTHLLLRITWLLCPSQPCPALGLIPRVSIPCSHSTEQTGSTPVILPVQGEGSCSLLSLLGSSSRCQARVGSPPCWNTLELSCSSLCS